MFKLYMQITGASRNSNNYHITSAIKRGNLPVASLVNVFSEASFLYAIVAFPKTLRHASLDSNNYHIMIQHLSLKLGLQMFKLFL